MAKICSYQLGDLKNALRYGQEVISHKDRAAPASATPSVLRASKGTRRVITYSVWGDQPAYLLGAAINITLAKKYFPGWSSRIYASSTLAPHYLDMYRRLGAEVVIAEPALPGVPTYFWRFMVADDPTVERYLCRDADCRLSAEEATLVDQWIASNKRFHIIRDHVLHDDLMLAGMWGGVASPDLGMEQKIAAYFNGRPTAKYGHDQRFLAQGIWPLVRKSALVHDRYYWTPGLKSVHHKFKVELGAGHVQTQQVERQAKNLGLID